MITVWFSRMILVDRLTVTVDGSALSGSGLDQRMFSGTSVLAIQIWPFRYRNPEVVNVADALDRLWGFASPHSSVVGDVRLPRSAQTGSL